MERIFVIVAAIFFCVLALLPWITKSIKKVNQLYFMKVAINSLATEEPVSVRIPEQIGIWNCCFFVEGGKPQNPEINPQSKDENHKQTRPTFDARSGNRTQATWVQGECSHHCAIPASQSNAASVKWSLTHGRHTFYLTVKMSFDLMFHVAIVWLFSCNVAKLSNVHQSKCISHHNYYCLQGKYAAAEPLYR